MAASNESPARRLARLREGLSLEQVEIANELGVTPEQISAWEAESLPIPATIVKLIEIYEREIERDRGFALGGELSDVVQSVVESAGMHDQKLLGRLKNTIETYIAAAFPEGQPSGRVRLQAVLRLVKALGDARGVPMKIAQILAFMDPRVPDDLREILASIQFWGRAMTLTQVERIIREEFGAGTKELFSEFSAQPVAMASIGQVHRARLKDGREVAVKVQYADIRKLLENDFADFDFIRELAGLIETSNAAVLESLRSEILAECDYRREAEFQIECEKIFGEDPAVLIPHVIVTHSSQRVLTSEWVDGCDWRSFRASAFQEDCDRAARTIGRFFATLSFGHGFLHADPHPGNYLFCGTRVAFLDFGRIFRLSQETRRELRDLHIALLSGDPPKVRRFFETTTLLTCKPGFDFDRLFALSQEIISHLMVDEEVTCTPQTLLRQRQALRELQQTGGITITPEFFWVILFTHSMMMSVRSELHARANWRANILRGLGA